MRSMASTATRSRRAWPLVSGGQFNPPVVRTPKYDGNPGSWEPSFGRYPWKNAGKPDLDSIGGYHSHSRRRFNPVRSYRPRTGSHGEARLRADGRGPHLSAKSSASAFATQRYQSVWWRFSLYPARANWTVCSEQLDWAGWAI